MKELALIIEDDEDLSEIFGQALTAANYDIEIIRDGAVAQERLKDFAGRSDFGYAHSSHTR